MRDIFGGMKFKFKPFGRGIAEVRLRIGAKAGLNWTRQPEIEQFVAVQVSEFTAFEPTTLIAMATETGWRLLDARQRRQRLAELLDWAHASRVT